MDTNELLQHILYELRVTNWQRAGGKGIPPKPPTSEGEITVLSNNRWRVVELHVTTQEQLADKRRQQRDHLRQRRFQRGIMMGVNDTISAGIHAAQDELNKGQASA